MSETPAKTKQWAQEAQGALQMALKLLQEDKQQPLHEKHKKELFKYAPVIAAYNRGIRDEAKVVDMAKFAFKRRVDDVQLENEAPLVNKIKVNKIKANEINFYIAYLDAHIAIKELNESDTDSIMEYLINTVH